MADEKNMVLTELPTKDLILISIKIFNAFNEIQEEGHSSTEAIMGIMFALGVTLKAAGVVLESDSPLKEALPLVLQAYDFHLEEWGGYIIKNHRH